ncbi:MAG: DUF5069 domain-containing protein [Opitutaceae bacterium]|jgi:hypothetical protein|nr:DUF5069 domain-containing protein [Opitutaceae bacterium]
MSHYTFPTEFRALYDHACSQYAKGLRGAETFFSSEQQAWLAANGITEQAIYDYAEDQANYGEPGFEHALQIETVRRDYFLNVQKGVPSGVVADPANWPAKDAEVDGIGWLPRILPKARAKLRGELPSTLMYGCGGDRRFLKHNHIMPAELLALVWRHADDAALVAWVKARRQACGVK